MGRGLLLLLSAWPGLAWPGLATVWLKVSMLKISVGKVSVLKNSMGILGVLWRCHQALTKQIHLRSVAGLALGVAGLALGVAGLARQQGGFHSPEGIAQACQVKLFNFGLRKFGFICLRFHRDRSATLTHLNGEMG